jgi:hypothetical protein
VFAEVGRWRFTVEPMRLWVAGERMEAEPEPGPVAGQVESAPSIAAQTRFEPAADRKPG